MSKVYVEVPGKVWFIVIGGSFLGLLSSNPLLTVASLVILPFLIFPLWRKGEAPILSFILFYQWLEVTLKVFHADLAGSAVEGVVKLGEGMDVTYFYSKEAGKAIWLCLGALASLAVGMRLGLSRVRKVHGQEFGAEISPFSVEKLFSFYIVVFLLSAASNFFVWRLMALSQPLLALMNIKWAVLFLLAYTVLQRRSGHPFLTLAFLLETAAGFLSYFAQFKGVIYIVALAFLTLHFRLRARHIFSALLILLMALYLGALWTVVKKEYRTFLEQTDQEKKTPSLEARAQQMSDLVRGFNGERLRAGLVGLTERIAYVDFFSQVLQRVPRVIPHANGELWKKAVRHVLTPRLFFQDKLSLESDSVLTRKYTGIQVAGTEKGGRTSIGIGYFAESYVDFGPIFMFIPVFLLGMIEGWICQYFNRKARNRLVGAALGVTALFLSANSMATSSTKILGSVLVSFIVLALLLKLFERPLIQAVTSQSLVRQTPR